MSKRLALVRHAKSSWADTSLADHERPLNTRGRLAAPRVARALNNRNWAPDAVLCSDATRAQMTWERMRAEIPAPEHVAVLPSLYMAGPGAVVKAIATLDDALGTVWLIGHNPGWEDAASSLCGFDGAIKTADCVLMRSTQASWADAAERRWAFVDHVVARLFE